MRPERRKVSLKSEVVESRLSNGLRVRLLPNQKGPLCSCYTMFRVGSRNERPGITGLSHFIEHLMLKGTSRFPRDGFAREVESQGGTTNAYTTLDMSMFCNDFGPESLETIIELEADRMQSLQISKAVVESERRIVLAERREKMQGSNARALEELHAMAFKAHSYAWSLFGWEADIERWSVKDCRHHYRAHYSPRNAGFYLSGQFEPRQALRLIKKHYGRLEPREVTQKRVTSEPNQRGERRTTLHSQDGAQLLCIGWKGPPSGHAGMLVFDLIHYALRNASSRLSNALVIEQSLASSVSTSWSWTLDAGLFVVTVDLVDALTAQHAESILLSQMQRLATEGLSETEREEAVRAIQWDLYSTLETNNGRAYALGASELYFGSCLQWFDLPRLYETITNQQIRRAAATFLSPELRNVVTVTGQA